jgi:hypothetical protein
MAALTSCPSNIGGFPLQSSVTNTGGAPFETPAYFLGTYADCQAFCNGTFDPGSVSPPYKTEIEDAQNAMFGNTTNLPPHNVHANCHDYFSNGPSTNMCWVPLKSVGNFVAAGVPPNFGSCQCKNIFCSGQPN